MKPKTRRFTVYLGGELFSLKHLSGNASLAEAIYEKSHGRFQCLLPQDFVTLRGRSSRTIRDYNLRALIACDLALFNFDGPDLDSGTVVEFMCAKFADIPSVLLRTDIRNAGDHRDQPWNLMASYFPRTFTVLAPSLLNYRVTLRERQRRKLEQSLHLAGQHSSAAAQRVCDRIATRCIAGLERVLAMKPVLEKSTRVAAYASLPLLSGIGGKGKNLRKEFEQCVQTKMERGLL